MGLQLVSVWFAPPWEVTLIGALLLLGLVLQERVYPLPARDDPANRGWLRTLHAALAVSRWLIALVAGCTIALGLLRWIS